MAKPPTQPDPVELSRRMSSVAHRLVQQVLDEDDDVLDEELGLEKQHNEAGEDA